MTLCMEDGEVKVSRYWDVHYDIDFDHSPVYFRNRLIELVADSMRVHLRSDVPVGAYVSGGIDSSLVTLMAAKPAGRNGSSVFTVDSRMCPAMTRAPMRRSWRIGRVGS